MKSEASQASSWWQTMPGMLTAIAVTIAALNQAGSFPIAKFAKSTDSPPINQAFVAPSA